MAHYEELILNQLLDTYESSILSVGNPRRTIHVEMRFTHKSIPAYFEESHDTYEQIHLTACRLEEQGMISIIWKGDRVGHIIEKVRLKVEHVNSVYEYAKRTPKSGLEQQMLTFLAGYLHQSKNNSPVSYRFALYLHERILNHQSVKNFIDLNQIHETEVFFNLIRNIELNEQACYIREFSVRVLRDSKELEKLSGKVTKVFRQFKEGCEDMSFSDILAEYQIYHTPNYVYIKGAATIYIDNQYIDLTKMNQGIGVSGEDLRKLCFQLSERLYRVLTIENLTTFFRLQEENTLMIYLGGYHNRIRQELLQQIFQEAPDLEYAHFGDIDAGGFEILHNLRTKTGIHFLPYKMNLLTLRANEMYSKPLTASDRFRLEQMIEQSKYEEHREVINYMLSHSIKLEQEAIMEDA